MLRWLRRLRSRSPAVAAIHGRLREPYYKALCVLYRRGFPVDLPEHGTVRIHPRLLGMLPSEYEPEVSAVLNNSVTSGMVVVDAGAHVGLHTLRLSRAVGERGRVIAIEPSPANASLLRTHLLWNGCRNVTVIEAAVGDRAGGTELAFRPDATDPGAFANSIAYDIGPSRAQVRVITIDDICNDLMPDVIKIDIEGAELLAVEGARKLLSRSAPVLIIAFHPGPMEMLGTSPARLVELLGELGYEGRHLDGSPASDPGFEEIVFRKRYAA